MRKYIALFLYLLISIAASAQNDTKQRVVTGRKNSPEQQAKPYVILISADGFRYDYAEKYKAKNLLYLSEEGVTSPFMMPSYPSVTFPNHYTIVTGLYPSHHGLVNNSFYDGGFNEFYSMGRKDKVADAKWYGGTPLWVLAEQQKMLSASFFWVASEAPIKDMRPTYYYIYNDQIDINLRISEVVKWLKLPAESRPHFITFYLPQVDHAGHTYGPDAPQTAGQVQFVDEVMGKLTHDVNQLGLNVNFIFVSDHGMTKIDTDNPIGIPAAIDTTRFKISGDGTIVELYAKNKEYIKDTYDALTKEANGYKVVLKEDMPDYLHYSKDDDRYNRIGDILLIPTWPRVFSLNNHKLNPGTHGFDPYLVKDMRATFYAWGPAFKPHTKVPGFSNVDIYPLVAKILGLTYTEKIDGTDELAEKVLK